MELGQITQYELVIFSRYKNINLRLQLKIPIFNRQQQQKPMNKDKQSSLNSNSSAKQTSSLKQPTQQGLIYIDTSLENNQFAQSSKEPSEFLYNTQDQESQTLSYNGTDQNSHYKHVVISINENKAHRFKIFMCKAVALFLILSLIISFMVHYKLFNSLSIADINIHTVKDLKLTESAEIHNNQLQVQKQQIIRWANIPPQLNAPDPQADHSASINQDVIMQNLGWIQIPQQQTSISDNNQINHQNKPSSLNNKHFVNPFNGNTKGRNSFAAVNKDVVLNHPEVDSQKVSKDKYNLQTSIERLLDDRSLLNYFPSNIRNLDKNQKFRLDSKRAIQKIQINHNINVNGELEVQQTQFQKTPQDLKRKEQRLKLVLQQQKLGYQLQYQISKYKEHPHRFCLITPSYNNAKSRLYMRNIDSIFMQDYDNYHVVYIDDASPDKTGQFVSKYIKEKKYPEQKIKVLINTKNVLALKNIYDGIYNHCKKGEIVMLIDGDDSFLGRQVMSVFNAVYHINKAGMVYSKYLSVSMNKRTGMGGSSRKIPEQSLKQDTFRKLRGFYTSHLLTFYTDLFYMVKKTDLTYANGTFFDYAYDVAIITPIIEMVNPRIVFLQETNYEYRFDTGMNDPGSGQMSVTRIVFDKNPYKRLVGQQLAFIDDFYKNIKYSVTINQQEVVRKLNAIYEKQKQVAQTISQSFKDERLKQRLTDEAKVINHIKNKSRKGRRVRGLDNKITYKRI